jgi:hypothetical protein
LPLHQLDELVARRSCYGLGFRKSFVIDAGGVRVWYVDRTVALGHEIYRQTRSHARRGDPNDFLWHLTPFIDFPGEYDTGSFRFEWEREWRVLDSMTFGIRDVAFLSQPGARNRLSPTTMCRSPIVLTHTVVHEDRVEVARSEEMLQRNGVL